MLSIFQLLKSISKQLRRNDVSFVSSVNDRGQYGTLYFIERKKSLVLVEVCSFMYLCFRTIVLGVN